MKKDITGVLLFPFVNRMEILVCRQSDLDDSIRKSRIYTAHYSQPAKVMRLLSLFTLMNDLVCYRNMKNRINNYNRNIK